MLANFLEKSKPINFTIYFGLFFCCFLIVIFSSLFDHQTSWPNVFKSVFLFFLFVAIFFFYHFVVSKNKLTLDNSFGFFLFTLALILFLPNLIAVKTLFLLLTHLFFLRKIYSLKSSKKVIKKLFDSGFWLGMLCLIAPNSILFVALLYSAILLHQKITFHTLITPVIGFISPLIIYGTYLFWQQESFSYTFFETVNFEGFNNMYFYSKGYHLWLTTTILLLTFGCLIIKTPKALSVNNSFKMSWLLLIVNLVVAILFALTEVEKNGSEIVFLTIPATIIIANGLEAFKNKIIKNILFSLLLVGTFITFFWL